MRGIHLLPLLCPPSLQPFIWQSRAQPPESRGKSGFVQGDGAEPLAWARSPWHLPTAPAFSTSGGRTARKPGHPQVLRMLLALHALFPPSRTILSITTLPGVAQQKVTMNFKALRKHFTADRRANARPRALPDRCPHGTTGSSPAS